MSHHDQHGEPRSGSLPSAGSSNWRGRIAFAVLLAVALFFLWTEHRAHLLGWLPFLIILACPLMHMFHHGGHGGHGGHGHGSDAAADPQARKIRET